MVYDFIIIGAGMAGLFAGYKLQKLGKSYLIIEKEKYPGGRAIMTDFNGKNVVCGAGIGRVKKDKILKELCDELNIELKTFTGKISYGFDNPINLLEYVEKLKQIPVYKSQREKFNMKEWLDKILGDYKIFSKTCGYTDYLKADILDTLYDYGFDDNVSGYEGYFMPWSKIIDTLYETQKNNIILGEKVKFIKEKDNFVYVNNYSCNKMICTCPVPNLRDLFKDCDILSEIDCQSFSRIYAKIGKGNDKLKGVVKNFTIVDSFLQKIIPMYPDDGIYMIAYNDNDKSDIGLSYFKDNKIIDMIQSEIKRIFDIEVVVENTKLCYWEHGTTYYLPLKKKYDNRDDWLDDAMEFSKNIYFCGEGFSKNQGWVEGSLESVIDTFHRLKLV